MDTIKLLLGMTVALLVGALAMSWKNFRQDVRATPKKELAEVQRQIAEIEQQRKLLQEEKERLMNGVPLARNANPGTPEILEMAPEDVPETGAVFSDDLASPGDTPPAMEPQDVPGEAALPDAAERAKAITAAAVVGKVTEWVEDPEWGSYGTLQILDAGAVKEGAVLSIRRNSGLIGKLKVTEVSAEGALVSPSAIFGDLKPVVGDELIVEP